MKKTIVILFALFSLQSLNNIAGGMNQKEGTTGKYDIYIGLSTVNVDAEGLEIKHISFLDTRLYPYLENSDTTFNFYGEINLTKHFGIEVGYTDFGEYEATRANQTSTLSYTSEFSGIYIAATGRYPITPNIDLTGKPGLLRWSAEVTEV